MMNSRTEDDHSSVGGGRFHDQELRVAPATELCLQRRVLCTYTILKPHHSLRTLPDPRATARTLQRITEFPSHPDRVTRRSTCQAMDSRCYRSRWRAHSCH